MAETACSTSESFSNGDNPTITDNSTSNCLKKAKIADTVDEDVISSLPDAVLCHILSFIPTKLAVSTSVLSKRWKLVWTSVPNLDFTFDYRVNKSNFMNFVDRVLSLNNVVHVRKVYLECSVSGFDCTEDCNSSRLKAWISAIAGRDTKDFNLCLPISCCIENLDQISRIVSLPDSFFIRQNLTALWLENIGLKVPTSVYFPSLKTMYLTSVQFLDEDSMKILLAGCPVLQSLNVDRGGAWDNAQTLYICSSTMSYLNLQTEQCDNKDSGYKVVIEAANLRSLSVSDYVNVDYDMNNMSSLVRAYVDFEQNGIVAPDGDAYNERLFEFFRKISQIQDLCLCGFALRALENTNMENMPMFNNLTRLKVELGFDCNSIFPDLFDCSPNLVTFVLEMDNNSDCEWYEPQHVPQCLLSSLENIEISGFENCDAEMEMVYYFLNNAMVLKKMVIGSYQLDIKTEVDIFKLLVNFPRSSSTCQVDYSNFRGWGQ